MAFLQILVPVSIITIVLTAYIVNTIQVLCIL